MVTPPKRFKNFKKTYNMTPPRNLFQVTVKGEYTQRKKWLQRTPLKLQGEVHPLQDIAMDKFPIFFGNASEDGEKLLIKFESVCEIYNVVENDVACHLFILNTVKEDFPRKDPYTLFLKLVEIQMNEQGTVKDFTFRFMKILHMIPQEIFPIDVIIFSCYEMPYL
jgi:hypothetical protein